jgi:hypothetical protein
VAIKYETYQLQELIKKTSSHQILLPNFQRDYVWKSGQQEKLAISCLVGLPIGGLLMLQGQSKDFSYRDIAGLSTNETPPDNVKFLLDGQQRMTTLKFIFDDPFSYVDRKWEEVTRNIPKSLKVKFFLDVNEHESVSDPFGYKELMPFNINKFEPSDLENRIKVYKVNLTGSNTEQLHHPKKFLDLEQDALKKRDRSPKYVAAFSVVKSFVEKKLVPLYTVFWDEDKSIYPYALHIKVIELIAKNRAEEIKQQFLKTAESETLDYFDRVQPGLRNEILNIETSEYVLDDGWALVAKRWEKSLLSVFEQISKMEMPSTDLPREEISRAAAIFEELNNSGTKLRVFDLLVARAARSDFLKDQTLADFIIEKIQAEQDVTSLNGTVKNWKAIELGLLDGKVLENKFQDLYLNLLSLISNAKDHNLPADDVKFIKKEAILGISPDQINANTEQTLYGISRALAFLQLRCGVTKLSDIPYLLMLLPLAYVLEDDDKWGKENIFKKLEFWYWDSLFTGRYRERQNEKCVKDVERIYLWLNKDQSPYGDDYEPDLLNDPNYNDLNTLLMKNPDFTTNENVAKALLQYTLSRNPRDLCNKGKVLKTRDVSIGNLVLQKHHLIPLGSATTIKQSSIEIRNNKAHTLNSPLNFSLISDKANNGIGTLPIGTYVKSLTNWSITSHFIPNDLTPLNGEQDSNYYERILTLRYNKIKDSILTSLNNLIS